MHNPTFVSFKLPLKEQNVLSHLGQHVNKEIRDCKKLSDEEKDTLLNDPVVYVHTWQEPDGLHLYVGESYDLTQRTKQHGAKSVKEEKRDWRPAWAKAIGARAPAVSFFFSSRDMNKSLCLDLEHSLCAMLSKQCVKLETKATTAQTNYSNKHLRDALLKDIWNVLKTEYSSIVDSYSDAVEKAHGQLTPGYNSTFYQSPDDLICAAVAPGDLDDSKNLAALEKNIKEINPALLEWPVIYMHVWVDKKHQLRTYVGETDDLIRRTHQHWTQISQTFSLDPDDDNEGWQGLKDDWRAAVKSKKRFAAMYVFGSPRFNESMTMDIEHRLIHYTTFLAASVNGRTNEQKQYSNRGQMHPLFQRIVAWLHGKNPQFLTLEEVKEKSTFMASPLMELTEAQSTAKEQILYTINTALQTKKKTLIVVQGAAGTGKTVLASSLFFHLNESGKDCHLAVNQPELINLYTQMDRARKLSSADFTRTQISQAEELINDKELSPEIVLVDESHLLYTQGHQGGIPCAQLPRILEKANITVLMHDRGQVVENDQLKNIDIDFEKLCNDHQPPIEYVYLTELTNQMRMQCTEETAAWIKSLSKEGTVIQPLKHGTYQCYQDNVTGAVHLFTEDAATKYQIAVFEKPYDLMTVIQKHKNRNETPSALLASYCWSFSGPVTTGNLQIKWHSTGKTIVDEDKTKKLWTMAEKANEVGYYKDIQGLDLMYAGVIIGPSVRYRSQGGKADKQAACIEFNIKRRCGTGKESGKMPALISNEHNVLLSRATKGLYIYAEDEGLRHALINAIKSCQSAQES